MFNYVSLILFIPAAIKSFPRYFPNLNNFYNNDAPFAYTFGFDDRREF
jgi:hypothetical protein